ncbi:hypothetical protein TRFO_11855 [Tritrichomonas foetus]|uniref:Uncharacterized protein n=1 Tax=Tritrichomonas foetus TaxID=1144522 RepID=A0A1J4J3V4_9EUKA|nr:hypothetical protein TRFO_11855 [Tritrichomonas foetus]|eukprot:OHS93425.1 hypothetical protein TRFO_11855 [Tritrichomonas foetus]
MFNVRKFKMDFYDSKAAVDAMAALQSRIRELEKNNAKVRKECQRLRVLAESDENTLNEREASLMNAADKAKQMLEGASESLVELRRVRHDNRQLIKTLDSLQNQLTAKLDLESKAKAKLLRLTDKKDNAEKLLKEYEDLFCEILSPPNIQLNGSGQIPFTNTIAVTTHSLPATLQTAVMMLQTLPFPFRDQKLEKKREIISILLNARDISYKIQEEIHQLELQKLESGSLRRIQAEIDVKSAHLSLLTQAMCRFRFE